MFQIKQTKKALHEQAEILTYWIARNKSNTFSKKILLELKDKELLLKQNPLIGKATDFEQVRVVIILKNFSLFYRVKPGIVEILSFWDNRRDPENIEI